MRAIITISLMILNHILKFSLKITKSLVQMHGLLFKETTNVNEYLRAVLAVFNPNYLYLCSLAVF
jgi:hypothetical protein